MERLTVPSLTEFLVWIAMSGGSVVIFSWIVEQIEAFQALPAKKKWWCNLGGSVVLALISKAILDFVPANILSAVAPYFATVAGVAVIFLANQVGHALDPNRK